MTLTILTGILSDVLVGVGLIVYYKTDQTRSSYVFFGIGGVEKQGQVSKIILKN